ncbi:MAG: response regulator [Cyanobacteria bacterium P01_H01_bin.121]
MQICQTLKRLGDQFELATWQQLLDAAEAAIANPKNSFLALSPVVIRELQRAQDQVLSGQPQLIQASAELQALAPASEPMSFDDEFATLIQSVDPAEAGDDLDMLFLSTAVDAAHEGDADASGLDLDQLLGDLNEPLAEPADIPAQPVGAATSDTPSGSDPDIGVDEDFGNLFASDASDPFAVLDNVPEPELAANASAEMGLEAGLDELNDLFGTATDELDLGPDTAADLEVAESDTIAAPPADVEAIAEPTLDIDDSGFGDLELSEFNTEADGADLDLGDLGLGDLSLGDLDLGAAEPDNSTESDLDFLSETAAAELDLGLADLAEASETNDLDLGTEDASESAVIPLDTEVDAEVHTEVSTTTEAAALPDTQAWDDPWAELDAAQTPVASDPEPLTEPSLDLESGLDLGSDLDFESDSELDTDPSTAETTIPETVETASDHFFDVATEPDTQLAPDIDVTAAASPTQDWQDFFDAPQTSPSVEADTQIGSGAELNDFMDLTAAPATTPDPLEAESSAALNEIELSETIETRGAIAEPSLEAAPDPVEVDLMEAGLDFAELESSSESVLDLGTEPSVSETSESPADLAVEPEADLFASLASEESELDLAFASDLELPPVSEADAADSDALELDLLGELPNLSDGSDLDGESESESLDLDLNSLSFETEQTPTGTEPAADTAIASDTLDLDALGLDALDLGELPSEARSDSEAAGSNLDDLADLAALDLGLGDLAGSLETADSDLEDLNLSDASDSSDLNALLDPAGSELELEGDLAGLDLGDLDTDLDSLLDEPESNSAGLDLEGLDNLEALLDDMPSLEEPAISGGLDLDDDFGDMAEMLQQADLMSGAAPSRATTPTTTQRRASRGVLEQNMRVPVKQLDNLNNLVGEMVVNRNSLEGDKERLTQALDNLLYQVNQLSDVGQRLQDLYERSLLENALLASRQAFNPSGTSSLTASSAAQDDGFDALEMDRFSGFHLLSQEMIELIVRVRESSSDIEYIVNEPLENVARNFRQVTMQIQAGLNQARMVPFEQTANRLPRAVRDISIKCGKQATLVVEGKETLIDKMLQEQLFDPMTHLVNNAVTHGVESPEARAAAGKPPEGLVRVQALHQGNQTVIVVADDGAGIDTERVRQKAIEKGLVTPEEAAQMPKTELHDFLFHAGFSTRDTADQFAGRGVGMDVVRTKLQEIRGTVSIDSTPGKGTTFTIRLPLTLSISKALCCISSRARVAFPMDGVEEMFDIPEEQIQKDEQGQPCIQWRDQLMPFKPLSDVLKYNRKTSRSSVYGAAQDENMVSVIILRTADEYLAIQVDRVESEKEIVIKQLEGPVPKPTGIAGVTVLSDGQVMPIADILALIDIAKGRSPKNAITFWEQEQQTLQEVESDHKDESVVLIIDDSITVRELLSMSFKKSGYRVEQVRDGQEAWDKLRSGLPCDLIFCDIEMPRMTGLELLERLQGDEELSKLPIAMLTSRGADRHRQMATQLGARGYFTKPYLEEALLEAASRMLKGEVLIGAKH